MGEELLQNSPVILDQVDCSGSQVFKGGSVVLVNLNLKESQEQLPQVLGILREEVKKMGGVQQGPGLAAPLPQFF